MKEMLFSSFILHPSSFSWKVAGYGWPGRFGKAVFLPGTEGSNPLPSAGCATPMVKRTSCLGSNEVFRVRVLVGLLGNKRDGDGTWSLK